MKTGVRGELIRAKGLSFSYEAFSAEGGSRMYGAKNETAEPVLKEISFTVHDGESVGLIGANGMGKSTLMKLMVGLYTDYSGELVMAGHTVVKENLSHLREHVGYVFQDSDNQLFLSTVEEDVSFGPMNYGLTGEDLKNRVEEALSRVHIAHIRHKQNYKLSGGEKKLAAIATILSMEPDIILMDEPSIALDPKNRRNLINILNELSVVKLIASHDLDFILDTCPRTILIDGGRIVRDGSTKEILSDRELLEAHGLELPLSAIRR